MRTVLALFLMVTIPGLAEAKDPDLERAKRELGKYLSRYAQHFNLEEKIERISIGPVVGRLFDATVGFTSKDGVSVRFNEPAIDALENSRISGLESHPSAAKEKDVVLWNHTSCLRSDSECVIDLQGPMVRC